MTVRIGITLPSFVDDPEVPLAVARVAEDAGLDGVFVFDHLFRRAADGRRRPALDGVALLGAVAAATRRVHVGALVFRAWLRPPAVLGATLATIARIAPGRVLAAIGAGDSESKEENTTFGLGFGTLDDRVRRLEASVLAARDRGAPVWVGGRHSSVRDVAARAADGWNAWGVDPATFAREAAAVRSAARRPGFECTWGGLALVGADDQGAAAEAARRTAPPGAIVGGPATVAAAVAAYRDAGAGWVVLGPIDASNPDQAARLGEQVRPLLGS